MNLIVGYVLMSFSQVLTHLFGLIFCCCSLFCIQVQAYRRWRLWWWMTYSIATVFDMFFFFFVGLSSGGLWVLTLSIMRWRAGGLRPDGCLVLVTIGVRFMFRRSSLPKVAALRGLCCRAFLAVYKLSTQLDDQDRCWSTTFAGRLLKIVTRLLFSTSYSDWLISDSCCSRFLPTCRWSIVNRPQCSKGGDRSPALSFLSVVVSF